MPITNDGRVTSSGRGLAGLLNVWRSAVALFAVDLPALWAAIGRLWR
jgi:hypothetical protein